MLRGFLALAAVFALLAAACGDDGSDSLDTSPTPTVPAASCAPGWSAAPGKQTLTLTSGGIERSYILEVPSSYDGTQPAPLVLQLHGWTMPAELMLQVTDMSANAEEYGAIVATPQALGDIPAWNWQQSGSGPDDIAFVDDLLAELTRMLCIDRSRVFAAGFSLGGGMVNRLVCDRSELFAAAGVVSATYLPCEAGTPVIAFHGDGDPIVPYEGGEFDSNPDIVFPPVRRTVSEWGRALGCDGLPVISRTGSSIELSTFVNCPEGDGQVLLYTVLGGGHTWPGTPLEMPPHIVGATTQEIDATALMLEFFFGDTEAEPVPSATP